MTAHATFPEFSLRDLSRADAPSLVRWLNDLDVAGWLARPPYPYRPSDADAFLDSLPAGWPHRAVIDVEGELVGMISVDPHLGYWLAPPHWGKRIVSRAARAILDAYFAATGADRVVSGAFTGNEGSLAVLRRLGFRESGRTMEYCRPMLTDREHIGFTLKRADWEARDER